MTGEDDQTLFGRRAGKSAAAFRTISEVASELDVPTHVLRFWEGKFPNIRPLKRGGGRRYYRPEDVDLLRRIRSLLYDEGYTIKGAQRVIKEATGRDPESEATDGVDDASPPKVASADLGPDTEPSLNGGSDRRGAELRRELSDLLVELRHLRALLDNSPGSPN